MWSSNLTSWYLPKGVKNLTVQFSPSVISNSLRPHRLQHTRLPYPSPTPGACSNSCPSSRWCHATISFCRPLLLLPSIFPSIRDISNESVLCVRWPNYWSFSFSISLFNEYSGLISFRVWLVWSSFIPRNSQESSPPQFKSSNSLALSFLFGPTLTSIHDYW